MVCPGDRHTNRDPEIFVHLLFLLHAIYNRFYPSATSSLQTWFFTGTSSPRMIGISGRGGPNRAISAFRFVSGMMMLCSVHEFSCYQGSVVGLTHRQPSNSRSKRSFQSLGDLVVMTLTPGLSGWTCSTLAHCRLEAFMKTQ